MAWRGRGDEAELVDDDDDDGAGEEHGAEHRHHKQGEVVEGGVAVAGGRGVLGRQVTVGTEDADALCPQGRVRAECTVNQLMYTFLCNFIFIFISVLSHWDFSRGKFRLLSQGKGSCERVALPTFGACWMFKCFHNPPNSDIDYRVFNVGADVNACDCTRGCADTRKRVCTES